ncbi:hypothetical protein KUTeg_017820 [Tegillarca granosa]|uniref:Transglutaminase-like domain-containing protein n=1 Tax=Tegillarca granosa TaxID=220873 RepID=A0ABQ9EG18_TEGGR|nr:hypothetical protein KUTeg_017820 [Tegillarca granosa]
MGGSTSSQKPNNDILAEPESEKISIPDVEPHYPPPYPPRRSKRDVFLKQDYVEVDEHAKQAPESLNNSWKDLTEYLTEGLTTDVQRLRSVFIWLGSQDIEGTNYENIKDKNSPLANMKLIKDRQGSYAVMFAKLCRAVNVPCALVRGYGKSVAYEVGDDEDKVKTLYNIWTTVFVQDNWHNVI